MFINSFCLVKKFSYDWVKEGKDQVFQVKSGRIQPIFYKKQIKFDRLYD
ncbi:hypothetical protein CYK57_01209 [Actinobacillus pleuropneumoniae]|uniref:Uncharacterized protein n=1 Tax=Actinobacillus pleuropneumoniae serovar 6 str. Femo TaxID=754256 RepID=A0A828PUS3_ACTPL|nr:hypothetical protein appser2_10610 [Actinobacillus pleuropneumoniae serovar 2 str. S1536]EFM89770.1 hypothetical protein appser4_10660 [Actinobacillus pleuropneumoniae serovar 4 str. M62]EFM91870.1 hypothetical protein appser6_11860 [Actinobacillus pleuropneumoniae serovar 6 str. Femo]EFM94132.1 hypothetical protein appser9_11550 [Actinobacillus pleuropneumoniae serovar 9 str. CVJ13261]EFM96360.1 hypothetical protein appser10_10820 [Actinobacillus pleuropneumoniae serovar 10 str. D13039]EFM